MARHGYLREYDEAPDRSDDRDQDRSDRNRGLMFDRNRDSEENRGFSGGLRDEGRTPLRDDDRQWLSSREDRSRGQGREHGYGGYQSEFARSGRDEASNRNWERSPRNFRSHQDDHYRSWRDRQIDALDQDYADYCREREQQFHSDFDNWRRNRRQGGNENRVIGEEAELELTDEQALAQEGNTPSPVGEATLGTNNNENTSRGRR